MTYYTVAGYYKVLEEEDATPVYKGLGYTAEGWMDLDLSLLKMWQPYRDLFGTYGLLYVESFSQADSDLVTVLSLSIEGSVPFVVTYKNSCQFPLILPQ